MFLSAKITIHWGALFLIVLAYISYLFISSQFVLSKYRKCVRAFESGDFDYVLLHKKLLFHFRKSPIPTGSLHYMLAVAYFDHNNDLSFLEHINLVTIEELQWGKHYWLALYAVVQGDFMQYDALQKELLVDSMDLSQKQAYEVLSLAYRHKKEGYLLSDEEREKVANCNYDRIKQIFA